MLVQSITTSINRPMDKVNCTYDANWQWESSHKNSGINLKQQTSNSQTSHSVTDRQTDRQSKIT